MIPPPWGLVGLLFGDLPRPILQILFLPKCVAADASVQCFFLSSYFIFNPGFQTFLLVITAW